MSREMIELDLRRQRVGTVVRLDTPSSTMWVTIPRGAKAIRGWFIGLSIHYAGSEDIYNVNLSANPMEVRGDPIIELGSWFVGGGCISNIHSITVL